MSFIDLSTGDKVSAEHYIFQYLAMTNANKVWTTKGIAMNLGLTTNFISSPLCKLVNKGKLIRLKRGEYKVNSEWLKSASGYDRNKVGGGKIV